MSKNLDLSLLEEFIAGIEVYLFKWLYRNIPSLVFYCLYVYQKSGNHRQDKYRITMETTFVNLKCVIKWNVHYSSRKSM